jgi:hypothetical protein
MLIDPSPFSVPVRILNEPDLFTKTLPFLTTALGFVLGLLAEPIKAYVMEKFAAKKVKPVLYAELASVLVEIEEATERIDEAMCKALIQEPPTFPGMAWYNAHHFNLVLRIDPKGGLMHTDRELKKFWEGAQANMASLDDPIAAGMVLRDDAIGTVKSMGELRSVQLELLERMKSAERAERKRRPV